MYATGTPLIVARAITIPNAVRCVWKVTEPDALMPDAQRYAALLAAKPISSLVHTKAAIVAPFREQIDAARARESASFAALMGGPANAEALAAFAEKRPADFTRLPPGA